MRIQPNILHGVGFYRVIFTLAAGAEEILRKEFY